MTEDFGVMSIGERLASWRDRALKAEAEIEAIKVAHKDDIEDVWETCEQICLAVADAARTDPGDIVSHTIVQTATHCAARILNRGKRT